ncbi:MAG: protein-disulfide reductase DsbD [Pseudomonadota bacterium]
MRAKRFLPSVLGLLALLVGSQALAIGEDEYLPPEAAFKYTATADEQNVTVEWQATKGYYLYKERMGLAAGTPGVTVGESVYPKGEIHKDDYFGEQEIFRGTFKVSAPLKGAKAGDTVALKLKWQGCADAGLCYPPSVWDASVKVMASARAAANEAFDRAKPAVADDEEYLEVDQAFALTGDALSTNNIQLNWRIADGYYLYKERIKVEPAGATKTIGALVLPKGESHSDDYFGEQEIYRQSLDATFSVPPSDAKSVDLSVTYQGCADAGLCYPPQTKVISISLEDAPAATAAAPATGEYVSEQDSFAARMKGNIFILFALGYLGGLLMSFTPCVLPMVPILTGIIAGDGENTTSRRGFLLALAYVAGISVIYTIMGIIAAYIGNGVNLQAIFNQAKILIPFALLFVVLAASMFGAFTIEMPSFIQSRLSDASNKQRGGTFVGVGVMGALSALIVSACVAPVLIGALTFVAQTGNALRGGLAMFAISLGMGTPLLLVGASAGALLPRAGAWMETIKNLFGVMFLAVAAWLLSRLITNWIVMVIWAVPVLIAAWVLWRGFKPGTTARIVGRALAVAFAAYGVVLLAGAGLGSTNPLAPIPQLTEKQTHLDFKRFKTVADLEREVAAASAAGHPVMVDFYADWCISCLEMEHKSFSTPEVQAALKDVVLLQADVTKNDDEDKALYMHFGIVGPPTIAFYGADGKERRNFRVVGYMKAAEFAAVVRQAVAPATQTAQ